MNSEALRSRRTPQKTRALLNWYVGLQNERFTIRASEIVMAQTLEQQLALTHVAIADTVKRFRSQPFDVLYESDIRAYLFSWLLDSFEPHRIASAGRVTSLFEH